MQGATHSPTWPPTVAPRPSLSPGPPSLPPPPRPSRALSGLTLHSVGNPAHPWSLFRTEIHVCTHVSIWAREPPARLSTPFQMADARPSAARGGTQGPWEREAEILGEAQAVGSEGHWGRTPDHTGPQGPSAACQDTEPHDLGKGPGGLGALSQGRRMAPRQARVADALMLRAPGPVVRGALPQLWGKQRSALVPPKSSPERIS